MPHRTDDHHDVEQESYEEKPEKGRWLSWILVVGLLLGTGSGSAFAWRAFDGGPVFSPFQWLNQPVVAATTPVEQAELEALQKQIANSARATEALLAAQQAEIKRLTDQMAALSSKLDLLQKPLASAQAALPAPTVAAPKKRAAKPADAKPTTPPGPVSTGGTPLPVTR